MIGQNLCRFCNIINGEYHYNEADQPFASNKDFLALTSIGALVEGWTLIIPKVHQISMRNAYGTEGFEHFSKNIISLLLSNYGPLIVFEHGSNKEGSITACGTDHAHLHLVPFNASLLPEMNNSGLKWFRSHTNEISFLTQDNEYLFYCEIGSEEEWDNPVGYLHILEKPLSQFFRHLIANQLGYAEAFDYRLFPRIENAFKAYKELVGRV